MTVKEYIEKNGNHYIKLGNNGSSGYIYCGTTEDLPEYIKKLNVSEPKRLKRIIKHRSVYLRNFNNTWKNKMYRKYKEYKRLKEHGKSNKEYEKYATVSDLVKHLIKLRDKDYANTVKYKNELTKQLKEYTDIMTREIVETYPSIIENKYGYIDEIIIYKGCENYGYWDLEEFESGIKQ